jgi:hypothetical protein
MFQNNQKYVSDAYYKMVVKTFSHQTGLIQAVQLIFDVPENIISLVFTQDAPLT